MERRGFLKGLFAAGAAPIVGFKKLTFTKEDKELVAKIEQPQSIADKKQTLDWDEFPNAGVSKFLFIKTKDGEVYTFCPN